jgi:hypothetical protein
VSGDRALERVRTGTWADPGRQTVGEYFEDWLTAVRPSLRSSTATSYEHTLRKWVIPRIGHLRLGALTSAKLGALYGELLKSGRHDGKSGLSTRSVAYTHRIVTHALKDAVSWGLLSRNPAAHVDPPRVARPEMHGLHAGGFALLATGDQPHFDIVLPDLSAETLGRLDGAFDPPEANPGRDPGRCPGRGGSPCCVFFPDTPTFTASSSVTAPPDHFRDRDLSVRFRLHRPRSIPWS